MQHLLPRKVLINDSKPCNKDFKCFHPSKGSILHGIYQNGIKKVPRGTLTNIILINYLIVVTGTPALSWYDVATVLLLVM